MVGNNDSYLGSCIANFKRDNQMSSKMLDQLLSKENLNRAYLQVYRKKGVGGVDGVQIKELKSILQIQGEEYATQIRAGNYVSSPILGVEIPKPNGKTRLLGIPTVIDRVFQQALHQVLQPILEKEFQSHSYGFRPNRNGQQAVLQSQKYINSGKRYIVDIDLKNFFDEVSHSILLELIYEKVNCAKTLKLLQRFLKAPIMLEGKLRKRTKGVPQGSPLSPLLSNIILNELDKELEK